MKTLNTALLTLSLLGAGPSLAGAPCQSNLPTPVAPTPIGSAIAGLTPAQQQLFVDGKAAYEKNFTVAEGLGPTFNARSCATCHAFPVTGGSEGSTTNNVTHFMLKNGDSYYLALELGGPVIQRFNIQGEPGGASCTLPADTLPTLPNVTTSHRHTPPVFGFGLLDAVPDDVIKEWAGQQPWKDPSVLGATHYQIELEGLQRLRAFTFDITRTQPVGAPRIGRFGWKAQTGTLFQFTSEPFNIELGVTTPFFPRENSPDGNPLPAGCLLANSLKPNDVASANTVKLYNFQALIAPPVPKAPTVRTAVGQFLFLASGCSDCHRPSMTTAKDYYLTLPSGAVQRVDALSNKVIFPYSDLLVHEMGAGLEDGRVMGAASTRFWRTTPLWGIQYKTNYLHDGSATSIHQAIERHGGEGQAATDRYNSLSAAQQKLLVEFVGSL
jgi:CxxC motif-containing protein (DUF1111 family)